MAKTRDFNNIIFFNGIGIEHYPYTDEYVNSFEYMAWTDGGCVYEDGVAYGGSAYVLTKDRQELRRASKGCKFTTNNRMELLAIMSAVFLTEDDASVLVFTDSQYAINMLTKMPQLLKNDTKNKDLLDKYYANVGNRKVGFKWVKGHDGNFYNELCDTMCYNAIIALPREEKV